MPDSNATINRTKLIERSFRRIGVSSPTATEKANAVDLLNDIIKGLDTEGKWLWAISNTPTLLTLTSGNRTYSVGTAPTGIPTYILQLETFDLIQGSTYTPLTIIGKSEAMSTSLREGTGEPSLVYLEKFPSMSAQKIHVFTTPNGTYNAQYTYRRRLYDFDAASDSPDFPQDWAQRLVKILSYELSPEFGIPLTEREILRIEAEGAINKGHASNVDESGQVPVQTVYY